MLDVSFRIFSIRDCITTDDHHRINVYLALRRMSKEALSDDPTIPIPAFFDAADNFAFEHVVRAKGCISSATVRCAGSVEAPLGRFCSIKSGKPDCSALNVNCVARCPAALTRKRERGR